MDRVRGCQHLTPIGGADHTRGLVEGQRDVVAVPRECDARVETHPHPDLGALRPSLVVQQSLRVDRRGEGARGRVEREE